MFLKLFPGVEVPEPSALAQLQLISGFITPWQFAVRFVFQRGSDFLSSPRTYKHQQKLKAGQSNTSRNEPQKKFAKDISFEVLLGFDFGHLQCSHSLSSTVKSTLDSFVASLLALICLLPLVAYLNAVVFSGFRCGKWLCWKCVLIE